MATVINNPVPTQPVAASSGGAGFLVGIILLALLVLLFFVYGLPVLRSSVAGPQINVPSKVNVHMSK